jgi:hypothetical protein
VLPVKSQPKVQIIFLFANVFDYQYRLSLTECGGRPFPNPAILTKIARAMPYWRSAPIVSNCIDPISLPFHIVSKEQRERQPRERRHRETARDGEVLAQEEVENAAEEEDERRQQVDGRVVREGGERQIGEIDQQDDRENPGGENPDRRCPLDCRMRLLRKKMNKRRTASRFIVTVKTRLSGSFKTVSEIV